MSVGKNILSYLRAKGISQSELAKGLNVTQQSLSRTLATDNLRVSLLMEITKILNLPVTYFFDGNEHGDNEKIEGYENRIKELENLNISLSKKLINTIDAVDKANDQAQKLLEVISVLFTTKNSEEAEKARLMLVSLVDFYKGASDIKNVPVEDTKKKSSKK